MEDKVGKNTQVEQQKENGIFKNEESLRNILDNMNHNRIHIMGIPGEASEQRIESRFEEIMIQNFLNQVKGKGHTSPGSSESPKQVAPKEAYREIHHN